MDSIFTQKSQNKYDLNSKTDQMKNDASTALMLKIWKLFWRVVTARFKMKNGEGTQLKINDWSSDSVTWSQLSPLSRTSSISHRRASKSVEWIELNKLTSHYWLRLTIESLSLEYVEQRGVQEKVTLELLFFKVKSLRNLFWALKTFKRTVSSESVTNKTLKLMNNCLLNEWIFCN